jgi:hypothetical protein
LKTNRHGSLREAFLCCLTGIETNRFFSWTFVKVLATRNFRERKKKLCFRELIKALEEYYSGKERKKDHEENEHEAFREDEGKCRKHSKHLEVVQEEDTCLDIFSRALGAHVDHLQ